MQWSDWVDIETLKILSQHASGVIGAIVVFELIGLAVNWGLSPGTLKTVLNTLDSFVLVGLVVWLAYQMGCLLWKKRVRNGPANYILAF